jgi:osmotically-inducible protein OsmY
MARTTTKLVILLLIFAAPLLLMAGSKKTDLDNTLAAQIEQRLVGVPNTVIVVVDETTKTAFLRGTVSSQADMDRIMELVRSVDGVRVIGSNLVVLNEPAEITRDDNTVAVPLESESEEGTTTMSTTVITDASLRSAVENALKSEGIMGQSKIKVETEDGVVTLTGTALSEAHADRIVAIAQSVPGVVGIQTNIQLRDQKRVYKVKPSDDRDKEGREVGEGESRVDDDDEDDD